MAKKQIVINLGDAQPTPCNNCNSIEGYQVTDNIKTQYTVFYEPDGKSSGGSFSEHQPITRAGTVPFCSNCGTKINFKVNRKPN